MVSVGFRVGLENSEERSNFAAGLSNVLVFNDDEVFTDFFRAVGWLYIDDDR